jgi:hypothetical protein
MGPRNAIPARSLIVDYGLNQLAVKRSRPLRLKFIAQLHADVSMR